MDQLSIHDQVCRVIIEHGWNIFSWKRTRGISMQHASFSRRTISNYNALDTFHASNLPARMMQCLTFLHVRRTGREPNSSSLERTSFHLLGWTTHSGHETLSLESKSEMVHLSDSFFVEIFSKMTRNDATKEEVRKMKSNEQQEKFLMFRFEHLRCTFSYNIISKPR